MSFDRARIARRPRALALLGVTSRPAPDQPPFVEVGSKVSAGDPLCLIEVMKLYTTIEAPVSGTIRQIAVEDAALVEFDQLLFVIAPD